MKKSLVDNPRFVIPLGALIAVGALALLAMAPESGSRAGQLNLTPGPEAQKLQLVADESPAVTPETRIGTFTGTITALKADSISVRTREEVVIVQLTDATNIYEQGEVKPMDEYEKELDAFRAALATPAESEEMPALPEPFEVSSLARSDLQIGDTVSVRTNGDVRPTARVIYRIFHAR